MRGLWKHFRITLLLNYKSGRALLYGYLMPVLFLVGFAAVFQSGHPRLLNQMGQILTITILGSTCLGMATALVSERERGLWRYYQLLPIPTNRLLASVAAVRLIIVAVAVLLQILLARLLYGTPFPDHPLYFLLFFPLVFYAFLGIGFIITALAKDVPSVQALGQCIFLPMILIGGVGIPVIALPDWAKVVASFMPGRYAVELLQAAYQSTPLDLQAVIFPVLVLFGIGSTSLVAGIKLMRWGEHQPGLRKSMAWLTTSLLAWMIVGLVAVRFNRIESSVGSQSSVLETVLSEATLASIDFDMLPEDNGFYTPLAPPLGDRRLTHRMNELKPRLEKWPPGHESDPTQAIVNLLCVAANADIVQDRSEAIIARMVFDQLQQQFDSQTLKQHLAWIILNPTQLRVMTSIPELGLSVEVAPDIARERINWYARKFLGRLSGIIPENSN